MEGNVVCKVCGIVVYTKPTLAQLRYAPELCSCCEKELLTRANRCSQQREEANRMVQCTKCRTKYRRIDLPNPGQCDGCRREEDRLQKLKERLKNPPQCTRCHEEDDADESNYPGLCSRCIDRQLDEEMEEEEAQDEIRQQREDARLAALEKMK